MLSSDRRRRLERLAEIEAAAATTVLVEARGLREAVARAAEAAAAGRLPAVADLEIINRVLRRGQTHLLLTTTDAEVWSWRPATPSLDEPLWPVAPSAAELLTSDRRGRIGVGEDDECGWLYLDASRNRRRRWCSMDGCGSRNKARRYDRRRRGAGGA
ncbi:MAG TPA: CGNR zinc finger domain-containing protein [Candidatus Dormibacteraeota bacterium]|nr:CGNR zinc finger domain-containing protein [Candidatus Dormibacteraeota bacterium]